MVMIKNLLTSAISKMLSAFNFVVSHLDPTDWCAVAAIVITIGFLCMRGYGSRANY